MPFLIRGTFSKTQEGYIGGLYFPFYLKGR